MILQIIGKGLKTGFALAAATTAAIMISSDRELGSPWAAINDVAHIVDGDEKEQPTEFSQRESGLGVFVNGTAMCAWGVLYEGALTVTKQKSNIAYGMLASAIAYGIDYYIVPKQYTPGIEKKLSGASIFTAYTLLGLTLGLSGLWNKSDQE